MSASPRSGVSQASIGYTRRELSKLLGLAPAQLQRFVDDEILCPREDADGEPRFTFQDLVLLRTAQGLRDADVPARRIRSALKSLRARLPRGRSATGVRIVAYGKEVVVRDEASVWNPESGQALFDFTLDELAERFADRSGATRESRDQAYEDPDAQGCGADRARDRELERFEIVGRRSPPVVDALAEQAAVAAVATRVDADGVTAQEWYDLGCELEAGSSDEAERAYRRALDVDSEHADSHLNLGRLLHERGQVTGAERHYRAALEGNPDDATAAFNLGVALEDLGRDREALDIYQQAIALDPGCADAYYNAAQLFERAGDKAAAVRCLKSYRDLRR